MTLERMLCMDKNEFNSKYINPLSKNFEKSKNNIDLDQFWYSKNNLF